MKSPRSGVVKVKREKERRIVIWVRAPEKVVKLRKLLARKLRTIPSRDEKEGITIPKLNFAFEGGSGFKSLEGLVIRRFHGKGAALKVLPEKGNRAEVRKGKGWREPNTAERPKNQSKSQDWN